MNSRLKFVVVALSLFVAIALLAGARQASGSSNEDQYRHLTVYSEVLQHIKSDYVEEPDLKSVTLGALNGLLESVDPYASYLSADQYKQYQKNSGVKKGGIGLVLAKRLGYVGIVDAIPGSPADKAGLSTGDILESINNVSTRDMPLVYAEMLLEGDPGSSIDMTVMKLTNPEPVKISVQRAVVSELQVTSKMLADQVALVMAPSFEGSRLQDLRSRIEDLERQGAKKLILDLRNNPTAPPESGIKVASMFLDKGLVTYTQGQKSPRQNFEAIPSQKVFKLPLVVMVNRGDAGGAEVAAAALQDSKRAEVVGERTYGRAGVRKPIVMDDGSAVILTVAKYYSPSGKSIQDNGVTPGVSVIETQPQLEADDDATPTEPKPKDDVMLQKAIEVLTKGAPKSAQEGYAGATPDDKRMTPLNIPVPEKR